MDENLRNRLDTLFQRQKEMQHNLHELGEECRRIDLELKKSSPLEVSDKLAEAIAEGRNKIETAAHPAVTPPPLPTDGKTDDKIVSAALAKAVKLTEATKSPSTENKRTTSEPKLPAKAPSPAAPTSPSANAGEWELNFGKVWLVRIGITLLLTGLIFLSTYAYKNWLFNAGPVVKVTFFMTISLGLTGLGMWLDKWQERFRQYGRVVAAGGLAAGYYTLYASHFVPSLKLIDSPILAALLLTLWAGLMLAYAVWKQSRVVAVMAIGLAFYGTLVNPSGSLSLFSALLLSSAGIWLMIKFRWVSIGIGTMVASYLAHALWLGFYPQAVDASVRFAYLASYWILFTTALTTPKVREIPKHIQRAFCAINNGTAWCLTVFMVPQMLPHPSIGWISIGIGTLWISLGLVAYTNKWWNSSLAVVFGYQGILIASLGILIESTGYTRFLVMAIEACILMAGARYYPSEKGAWLARLFSGGAFLAALLTALPEMNGGHPATWPSYAALALISAAYTALVRRDGHLLESSQPAVSDRGIDTTDTSFQTSLVPLLPAFLTWIILGMGVFQQWAYAAGLNGLMMTAATLMLSYFLIKHPRWKAWTGDIAMLGIFACLAGVWWYLHGLSELTLPQSSLPWLVIATFWYMSPKLTKVWDVNPGNQSPTNNQALEWLMSILFWVVTASTLIHHVTEPSSWMFLGGIIAITGHTLAEYLRRPSIGSPALIFHLGGLIALTNSGKIHPALGWAPAAFLLAHFILSDSLWKTFDRSILRVAFSLGLVMAVGIHAFQVLDQPELILTILGLILIAWAYQRKDTGFAVTGGISPLIIACISTVANHGAQDWIRYIPILATLVTHALLWQGTQMNKDWIKSWKSIRVLLIVTGLSSLIWASTVHVRASFDGAGVAICWSLLATALFCIGLAMRCRPYRLIGLWWLAASVLHVVCIDVMKLDTLGRILSFLSLGLLLLALGFLYNKFQETIRKFL